MSECFPAIYPRARTLGKHTHREPREGGWWKENWMRDREEVRNKDDKFKEINLGVKKKERRRMWGNLLLLRWTLQSF